MLWKCVNRRIWENKTQRTDWQKKIRVNDGHLFTDYDKLQSIKQNLFESTGRTFQTLTGHIANAISWLILTVYKDGNTAVTVRWKQIFSNGDSLRTEGGLSVSVVPGHGSLRGIWWSTGPVQTTAPWAKKDEYIPPTRLLSPLPRLSPCLNAGPLPFLSEAH